MNHSEDERQKIIEALNASLELPSPEWIPIVGAQVDAFCFDEWRPATILSCPNNHTDPQQRISGWKVHQVRFKSGATDRATGKFISASAEGFLFDSARMLIVRQGELSMFSKRSANSSETYIGRYDNKIYQAEKGNLVLKTRYLIYLLSDDNELLHQSPLQFTGKGCFGATFADHLRSFQTELQKSYGKQRGLKFLLNGVFAVKTTSELRGEPPNTAYVTVASEHLVPTQESWKELFVGYDEPLRERLLADYEAFSNFDLKNQPAPAEDKTTVESTTAETINHFDYLSTDSSGIPF